MGRIMQSALPVCQVLIGIYEVMLLLSRVGRALAACEERRIRLLKVLAETKSQSWRHATLLQLPTVIESTYKFLYV